MKTRRIYLQPGESVEIINQYGTSVLKAITRFKGDQACVVLYEQPDVFTLTASEAQELNLSIYPVTGIIADNTEQNGNT